MANCDIEVKTESVKGPWLAKRLRKGESQVVEQQIQLGEQTVTERMKSALESKEVTQIAANTFTSAYGNSDIIVLLERNGSPVAILNLSYTLAKSLAIDLSNTVAAIENGVGQAIPTMNEIEQFRLRSSTEGKS